eukprot:1866343-Pyramimonas_sp.AAC.1
MQQSLTKQAGHFQRNPTPRGDPDRWCADGFGFKSWELCVPSQFRFSSALASSSVCWSMRWRRHSFDQRRSSFYFASIRIAERRLAPIRKS